MTQESRLVIRVDSKLSETQVKDLDKALMLLERTGLSVTRTAKTTSAEITALGRESDTATRSIDRATAVWSKFNSVVALAGVGLSAVSAINMYKSVAANVESLRLFSQQIGITTEQLSSLRYAADDMAGVSSRTLDPALRRMTRRIQEAANESGPAANALKMLRLEAKALSELDVESQLYAVADALKDLPNHADKLRATMAIFDTEGMPLVNMLNQGADAIRAAQIEAEQLNQTISQVDADRVGRLNSEFSKLSARLDGIKTQSMLGFLPVVEDLNAGLNVLADNFDAITAVVGGAGLVALSRYTGGLIETRVETIKSTLGKRNAVRAELDLARAQQLQTAETLRQTLALNTQNVTRVQTQAAIQADIAARARLTAAEAAMTAQMTASTAAMGLARGALGLVGGPFGALTLAVTAGAAAWYKHEQRVRENRNAFESLKGPLDELIAKYEKMDGLQKQGFINEAKRGLDQALKDEKKLWDDLGESIVSSTQLYSSAFDEKTQALLEFRGELNLAKESGSGLADIIQQMSESEWLSDEDKARVQSIAAELRTLQLEISGNEEKISKLEAGFKGFGEQAGGLKAVAGEVKGLLESDFTKLINGLTQTLDVIGMSAQQAAEYKARLEGANEQQAQLAGVLAGMADAARQVEKATQEKDDKALKGAQALLDKLIEQEVQIRMNIAYQAEYAMLTAMGIEATIASQGAGTASQLEGLKAQEEIVARIKAITGNITANTVPSLKKTGNAAKQLSNEIDNLIGSLFPAIKAEQDWVKQQKLLDEALKKGKLTKEQHAKGLVKIREQYELIAFAVPEHVKALQDEGKSLKDSLPGLRDRVRHFGLSATAIAKLAESETKASLVTAKSTLAKEQSTGASEKRIKQIEQEIKALEELAKHQSEAVGHTEKYERLELEKKANDEALDEWQKTVDKYGDVFRDGFAVMLNDGRSDWKSWGQSLVTTFKTTVADQLYKLFAEPFVARIALSLSGLGASGIAAATSQNSTAQGMSLLGGLKGTSSLASVFSGSVVSGLSSGIGSVGNLLGSHALQSFSAGMAGTLSGVTGTLSGASSAASLGTTVGTGAIANPAFAAAVNGGSLTGAAGMGAQFAAVAPWLAGGAAVLGLGLMAHNMMKGETRHGAYMQYDLAARQAVAKGGPSGGYGGQATIDAATQLFGSTVDTINSVLEGVGAKAQTAWFHGMFESSDKGRGGTFAGGSIQLADGSIVDFGTSKKGDGFGGKSGTAEEMFANLQSEVHFAALEAWKVVGTEMPQVIRDMLAGVDVRSLTAEQAQGLVAEISNTVGAVNALSDAFNQMPLENLKNLTFDVAHGLGMASGGLDALSANVASFYQGFYSEAERQEHLHRQLVDTLGAVNVQLPSSREGFRQLVDSLGEVTEANQHTIAALLGAASAADQYYAELERRQNEAHQERQRLEQEAYNSARSHVDKLMSAFKELAQKQIRELEQVSKSTDKVANALQKSLNTQISSLTSVSSMLTDMVNELRGGAKLFEMQSAEGWRLIGNTISTGVLPDAEKLRSAVGSIRSDLDDRYYGSIFERQRDQLVLANQLDSINALAKPQLTIAEQQLQVMQDQLAELREGTKRAFELAGLSQAQIAAIKAVDDKTAANVGLTKDQLEALRTGNNASTVLQNLTREQIQGILGVKSEVVNVHGLTAQQLAELSRNTGVANVIKSLTDVQIAALKAVDDKTAKALGLSESQISALQSGNAQALALQGLTREQLQGILGVKSETSSLHGLSQSQIDAMRAVDLNTQSVAELIKHLQTSLEAEKLASKQIETIQSQLGTMQAQYEQLRDLNTSMGSLDEGMRLLAVAMKAEQVAKPEPSNSKAFGGRDFQFSSQSAAKNYLLGNTGLLGAFAEEVAKGWASPTDYLKYAQLHYSDYGWAENRNQSVGKNQGRTHKPGGYSEAQAYLAANQDVMTAYLREVKSGGAAGGDRGMLAFVQSHFDQYGRHEMPLRKYARGGDHMGGLRLVGELGPELEVTGPSRIFNANKTQDILRNMSAGPDISGLMQGLIRENQQLRQMYETMMRSMIAMQQRMARVLERWEGDDYTVRIEEMPSDPVVVKIKKEVA